LHRNSFRNVSGGLYTVIPGLPIPTAELPGHGMTSMLCKSVSLSVYSLLIIILMAVVIILRYILKLIRSLLVGSKIMGVTNSAKR
jgi:hypothetical protein